MAELGQRNAEIVAMQRHVHLVARRLIGDAIRYDTNDIRDLEQDGYLALCRAALRHERGRETFQSFTNLRLLGAMKDGLRRWAPRYRRCNSEKMGQPRATFVPLPEYPIDLPAVETDLDRRVLASQIRDRFDDLPALERRVMNRTYVDGWTQIEISRELKCHESYVSQLHIKALKHLRAVLKAA